jgi:hypothetical protein
MAVPPSFDISAVRAAVHAGRVHWRMHALERLAVRGLSTALVKQAIVTGEMIEEYPASRPYPRRPHE